MKHLGGSVSFAVKYYCTNDHRKSKTQYKRSGAVVGVVGSWPEGPWTETKLRYVSNACIDIQYCDDSMLNIRHTR